MGMLRDHRFNLLCAWRVSAVFNPTRIKDSLYPSGLCETYKIGLRDESLKRYRDLSNSINGWPAVSQSLYINIKQ